jgi:hypothetical protein
VYVVREVHAVLPQGVAQVVASMRSGACKKEAPVFAYCSSTAVRTCIGAAKIHTPGNHFP